MPRIGEHRLQARIFHRLRQLYAVHCRMRRIGLALSFFRWSFLIWVIQIDWRVVFSNMFNRRVFLDPWQQLLPVRQEQLEFFGSPASRRNETERMAAVLGISNPLA